jgi:hypothetical protein
VAEAGNNLEQLVRRREVILQEYRSMGLASNPYAQRSVDFLTRHIRLFGKFFRRLQELSSPRFVTLPSCATLVAYYWGKVEEATKYPESIAGVFAQALFICALFISGLCRLPGGSLPG